MKKYLLFDLDGTLTDPKTGITTCVQYALHSMGIEEVDLDKLECFIGPPLQESFMEFYGMTKEQADKAIEKYRERFRDIGIFENTIYRGIPKMLKSLRNGGMHLAVASSKPTVFVERILEYFDIREYFEVVVGSELDGTRGKKEEVVQEALRQLFDGGEIRTEEIYMIGDTKFDVEGAHAWGIEAVGVAYGYGGLESLKEAKADYIVANVEQLQNFLERPFYEQEAAKPQSGRQKLMGMLLSIAVFLTVRCLLVAIMATVASLMFGNAFVQAEGFSLSVTLVSYLGAGAALLKGAKHMIAFAIEDRKLLHIMPEPASSYLLMTGAAVGSVLGLNLLFGLTGLTVKYGNAGQDTTQWTGALLALAIVTYGVVTPLAEEALFRGIVYNRLRRSMTVLPAIILSAALFGIYHGNVLQAVYAFLLGALMAYGYEYFGGFRVAVSIHMGANLLALLVPFSILQGTVGWSVCVCSMLAGVVCTGLLWKRKK